MADQQLARFDLDATPPLGHSLCGGWITPVVGVDDPLRLRGVVLQGAGRPIVLATLDWTGLLNESYRQLAERIAAAARTTADRVQIHCVHQHNAPFACAVGNALLRKADAKVVIYDEHFMEDLSRRAEDLVRASLTRSVPITQVAHGEAKVEQVACNRRVIGPDGKIKYIRYSATTDPLARAEPEGTIDPILRSISLGNDGKPVARFYFYTVHPMSYYGDGRVSSDFVGLARAQRDREERDTTHLYFTGCAGNVTAGKYNDGAKANRAVLTSRIHKAMVAADDQSAPQIDRLDRIGWTSRPHVFSPREDLDLDKLKAIVANPKESVVNRNRTAMTCGWLLRLASKSPVLLSRLDLGETVSTLHLPAETFVEYQLEAQAIRPRSWLATAAYSDDGPWYIPLTRSFAEGGYEPSASFVSPTTELSYRAAIRALLLA